MLFTSLEILVTLHTRTAVRECCKDDDQSQWIRANFDPTPWLNSLTDLQQNLNRWLHRGYLPPCNILFRSDNGFRFGACACTTSRTIIYSAILFIERELTFAICCLPSICRVSSVVVFNARANYSGGCNFRQFFYGIWYLGHSDFGLIEAYISETVQYRKQVSINHQ